MPCIALLPNAIFDILADTSNTKVLTPSDRYGLMAAVLDETLSLAERQAIDRILRAVRQGQVRVV
ncbi:MAG: hypothetical protein F6J87_13835 [Spirulina sp. SIO3F2]|nr:hypothetical protein [Spirulina sp. SIO3F2]